MPGNYSTYTHECLRLYFFFEVNDFLMNSSTSQA